jgi:hypothetical protein
MFNLKEVFIKTEVRPKQLIFFCRERAVQQARDVHLVLTFFL